MLTNEYEPRAYIPMFTVCAIKKVKESKLTSNMKTEVFNCRQWTRNIVCRHCEVSDAIIACVNASVIDACVSNIIPIPNPIMNVWERFVRRWRRYWRMSHIASAVMSYTKLKTLPNVWIYSLQCTSDWKMFSNINCDILLWTVIPLKMCFFKLIRTYFIKFIPKPPLI